MQAADYQTRLMADPMNATLQSQLAYAQSALGNAQAKLQTLQDLAKAPKAERQRGMAARAGRY